MKRRIKIRTFATVSIAVAAACAASGRASAGSRDVIITLPTTPVQVRYPAALRKAGKVTVRNSRRSVVHAVYRTGRSRADRRIILTGKEPGTAAVTVTCRMKDGESQTCRYHIEVRSTRKKTALEKGKEAFRLQNQLRQEQDVPQMEWSDELYRFCLYRMDQSGYDGHENLERDMDGYFGMYAGFKKLTLGENLYSGSTRSVKAVEGWKSSPGHYYNLMKREYASGAIACRGSIWCAVFSSLPAGEIGRWREYRIREVTVKRYSSTGGFLAGTGIGCYESGDKWGTLQVAEIREASGRKLYLEEGKTYTIYERSSPSGCGRASPVTFTVTEHGSDEVVLVDG